MLVAKAAYEQIGLNFCDHAIAITARGSALDKCARNEHWLATFPMWDWVGGRTSETSAVGLLPAALQGFDVNKFLSGARSADELTRSKCVDSNPAAQLALAWYAVGNGIGDKNMVVIPYKDQLELLGRYLQQLIMESLGKNLDRSGNSVSQGITVFGNKGSTDQHSYMQQLIEGLKNHFVTFVEVLGEQCEAPLEVEPSFTTGDYLNGFYLGTRKALSDAGRESITLSLNQISAATLGSLIAVFERAVGFYASLLNLNAYHQPGVEAGKKAAQSILEIEKAIMGYVAHLHGGSVTCTEIAEAIRLPEEIEHVFKICRRASQNGRLVSDKQAMPCAFTNRYSSPPH